MSKNARYGSVGIDVFLERRKSKEYVGRLIKAKLDGKLGFEFSYQRSYLLKRNSIPLGPEFPLAQERFFSRKLFPSFEDRIPSKQNPAYPEYLLQFELDPNESDPIVLLSTIGRRGPSSFVFEPIKEDAEDDLDLASFRKSLGLTIREFAAVFNTSPGTVQGVEAGKKRRGEEVLKRLQIYMLFPKVALWEARKNRALIHDEKYQQVIRKLEAGAKVRSRTKEPGML